MSGGNFQVIAATPRRSPDEVSRLADLVGDAFDVDLSGLLEALTSTGVCVTTASTLTEARAKGAKIISAGADYHVVDASGKQVDTGEAKGRIAVTPRTPARSSHTMMGIGTHLIGMAAEKLDLEDPGGFAASDSKVAEDAANLNIEGAHEIELEDSGGFATIDSSVAEGGVEFTGAEAHDIQIEEHGGFAVASSSIDDGAMALDAPEQKLELELEPGGFASAEAKHSPSDGIAVPAGPDKVELEGPGGFAGLSAALAQGAPSLVEANDVTLPVPPPVLVMPTPRAEGGFDLDALDGDALVMLDGTDETPMPQAKPVDDTLAPPVTETTPAFNDAAFLPPAEDDLDMGALDIDLPSANQTARDAETTEPAEAPLSPMVGAVVEVPMSAPTPGATSQAPSPVAEELPTATLPPSEATPLSSLEATRRPERATLRKGSRSAGFQLLGGWFSDRPRVRVIMGFMATLLLASALPLCQARSVRTNRIEELRVDLATAKAHGAAAAGNRTVREIEASISSIQTRHTIYALIMWCALMALLLFLWFRFT